LLDLHGDLSEPCVLWEEEVCCPHRLQPCSVLWRVQWVVCVSSD
jgi:hypothetical protein